MTPLVEQTRLNEVDRYKMHIIRGPTRLIAAVPVAMVRRSSIICVYTDLLLRY